MTLTRSQTSELLTRHGLAPRRSFGQNFVVEPETVRRIATLARVGKGDHVLEIGAGLGTDLAQYARHGANVTDLDLSATHLLRARENFELRGLRGRFFHHDAESLPFPDASFDVVYCNGVLHHTPNTQLAINEIFRVLRPGGRVIAMVYAENSLNYWRNVVGYQGLLGGRIHNWSIWRIMSESVEISRSGARPLVKVYTAATLRKMFDRFSDIEVYKRQLTASEIPMVLRWLPPGLLERLFGWNLIVKGKKLTNSDPNNAAA